MCKASCSHHLIVLLLKLRFIHRPQVVADGPAVAFGPEKKGGLTGFEHPDKLNLAGLLNVLDGVVCCPNRIVGACAV